MTTMIQTIVDKYQGSAPQNVIRAVEKAARATGADFAQLMQKAATESSFNPAAKSKTSSATGLFQFIDSTWLGVVKEHGAKFGLGHYADQIQIKNGKACVTDCDVKKEILNLRKNPEISAIMAGMAAAEDRSYLQSRTNADIGSTEMYLAHFMGAGGAAKFINAREDNGNTRASALFPREAQSNRSIFYTASGQARSLDQVYDLLAKKMGNTAVAKNNNSGTENQPLQLVGSGTTAPASSTHTRHSSSGPASDGSPLMPSMMAQARSFSAADITWYASAVSADRGGFSSSDSFIPSQKLSANSILLLAELQHGQRADADDEHSRYNA